MKLIIIILYNFRFNHSCTSNAEGNWNEDESTREIRAVKKIKKGEEITICYLRYSLFFVRTIDYNRGVGKGGQLPTTFWQNRRRRITTY